jgi:hypothetical protein
MLEVPAEIRADRRGAECRGKGGPLGGEPNVGFGGNMRHIDHLEIGGRHDGSGLDGEDSRDGDEAADVFEHAGGLGGGGDACCRYENTHLHVHRIFQNDIGSDIILEVLIYIPEHIRRDVNGAHVRSGRGSDLHTTAREAVVSVSFSAFAVLVTLKHRRGGGGLDGGLTTARCCDGLSQSMLWSGGSGKWSRGFFEGGGSTAASCSGARGRAAFSKGGGMVVVAAGVGGGGPDMAII